MPLNFDVLSAARRAAGGVNRALTRSLAGALAVVALGWSAPALAATAVTGKVLGVDVKAYLRFIAALMVVAFSNLSYARVDCPPARVSNIQIEATTILYSQEGYPWRKLGVIGEPGTKERYAALLYSQAAGRKVLVSYERDTFDCLTQNYGDSALLVRTYND